MRTCARAFPVACFLGVTSARPVPGEGAMTPLRQRFLDDLRLRNYSPRTVEVYVSAVARCARHFGRSPEGLGPEEVRSYQLHLLEHEHASWSRFNQTVCALGSLFGFRLGRPRGGTLSPF